MCNLGIQARKRRVIEDPGRGVADLFHRDPHAARLFVGTFVASSICGLADARRQGKRTFEHPNHLADGDFGRFAAQHVAAPLPLLAVQQAGAFQLEEDGFKKLPGQPLAIRKLGNEHRPAIRLFGEHEQRFQAVFRLAGEHVGSLYRIDCRDPDRGAGIGGSGIWRLSSEA